MYNDIKQEQSYCVGSFVPNMTGKQIRPGIVIVNNMIHKDSNKGIVICDSEAEDLINLHRYMDFVNGIDQQNFAVQVSHRERDYSKLSDMIEDIRIKEIFEFIILELIRAHDDEEYSIESYYIHDGWKRLNDDPNVDAHYNKLEEENKLMRSKLKEVAEIVEEFQNG